MRCEVIRQVFINKDKGIEFLSFNAVQPSQVRQVSCYALLKQTYLMLICHRNYFIIRVMVVNKQ